MNSAAVQSRRAHIIILVFREKARQIRFYLMLVTIRGIDFWRERALDMA